MTMGTYSGKIKLLKMKNACIISVKGKDSTKRGVFIPIEDNGIFVSTDTNGVAKNAYMDIIAFANKNPDKFGNTHILKPALSKEARSRMTEEQLKTVPILGNMKPFGQQPIESEPQVQTVKPIEPIEPSNPVGFDDLPF